MHITIICNASIDLKMKIYRQNDYFIIICQIVSMETIAIMQQLTQILPWLVNYLYPIYFENPKNFLSLFLEFLFHFEKK